MGGAVVLHMLLLLDGDGCCHTARYVSQYPWKWSQLCYGGLQEGIFTLWLFNVCVCVCVRSDGGAGMQGEHGREEKTHKGNVNWETLHQGILGAELRAEHAAR